MIPEVRLEKIFKQDPGARTPTSVLLLSPSSPVAGQTLTGPAYGYSTIVKTLTSAEAIPQLFERSEEIKMIRTKESEGCCSGYPCLGERQQKAKGDSSST